MHLLTATKKSISAAELQRQLGHKRYQPIWEMMHKLRSVMGKRDDKYTFKGNIELDEGFFSTETPDSQKQEKLKSGAGSQKKSKVLVIAESTESENQKRGQKPKKVGHIKMIVVPNLRMVTIDGEAVNAIEPDSSITTDAIKDGLSGISGEENPVESVSIAKVKEMKNRLSSGYTSFWS